MSTKTWLCSFGAALLITAAETGPVAAQISTDRPKFTIPTTTVPDGALQLEMGYSYFDTGSTTMHTVGEPLFRFGMIPGLELRIELPSYQTLDVDRPVLPDIAVSGIGDAGLGVKLGLYEAGMAEGIPSLSLLLGTVVPTGDDDLDSAEGWEPEAILALGWEFAPRLELGTNIGYAQRDNGNDRYDEFLGSVSIGFPLTQRLSGFGEYYAIRPDIGGDEDWIDGGILFLVAPDLQLDARIGVGVGDTEDALQVGIGFAKLF